jgi:putative flippase GtrA
LTSDPLSLWAAPGLRLRQEWQRHETFRFLVVGAYNTVFGYAAFVAAYFLFRARLHYLVIMVLAHILAVANAFLGHRFLTFRVKGQLLSDFLRFNLTYLGALVVGLLGLPFLVEVCHLHPLLSQAMVVALTMVGSYVLHKKVSFRRP